MWVPPIHGLDSELCKREESQLAGKQQANRQHQVYSFLSALDLESGVIGCLTSCLDFPESDALQAGNSKSNTSSSKFLLVEMFYPNRSETRACSIAGSNSGHQACVRSTFTCSAISAPLFLLSTCTWKPLCSFMRSRGQHWVSLSILFPALFSKTGSLSEHGLCWFI